MIISGGVNIYPQEAENLLMQHPAVADVAVIGVPDPDFGQTVKAIVQPMVPEQAGDDLADELMEYCRSKISHIKCPKSIDFESEFPRMENGKLFKKELIARYQ